MATFKNARFFCQAEFAYALFKEATFKEVEFSSRAGFIEANFGKADFAATSFSDVADFNSAAFTKEVGFTEVIFRDRINFVNTQFSANTSFACARFQNKVPDFRGATMHEATEWHGATFPTPPKKDDAQQQVYAYERLKQEMERLKKHEDEMAFFSKELRARRGLLPTGSGAWLLNYWFEVMGGYGNSTNKPLLWLLGVFVVGAVIFAWIPLSCGTSMPISLAAKLSFANIFVFLPSTRELIMGDKMVKCLSNTAQAVTALQSLSGLVLLFLLGLSLRNRFRMK